MAHQSNLKLYNVPFGKDENFILDDAFAYLYNMQAVLEVPKYQFVYPQMNLTIKVRLSSDGMQGRYGRPSANYAMITTITDYPDDEDLGQWGTYTFYFVDKIEYIDTDTVRLTLTMDTLNTFVRYCTNHDSKYIPWSPRTKIIRQHKERYIEIGTVIPGAYLRMPLVDFRSEGISTTKQKLSDVSLSNPLGKWYVMFKTDHRTGIVKRLLFAQNEFEIQTGVTAETIRFAQLSEGQYWHIPFTSSSGQVVFKGTTYNYAYHIGESALLTNGVIIYVDGDQVKLDLVTTNNTIVVNHASESLHATTARFTVNAVKCYIASSKIAYKSDWDDYADDVYYFKVGNAKLFQLKDVKRTFSQILKIVEYPYPPVPLTISSGVITIPEGMTYEGGYIVLNENVTYSNKLSSFTIRNYPNSLTLNPGRGQEIGSIDDYIEEPKLLHSDFYNVKFVYDSFYYEIPLERMSNNFITPRTVVSRPHIFNLYIYPSMNISSTFLFKVEPESGIKSSNDYEGFVSVKRNNEVALYTDSYLEYIRSGYNYDVKQRALQERGQVISTLISAVGMVASFASSVYTGGAGIAAGVALGTSLAASSASLVNSISSNEISMASKMASLQKQGESVSGAEDLDLLNVYCPTAKVEIYETVDTERKNILNLLRLKGYACDEWGIPDTRTRLYFNYLQCDAVFDMTGDKFNPDLIADVKEKMSNGVTFIHAVDNAYDFEQQYENWEISLM